MEPPHGQVEAPGAEAAPADGLVRVVVLEDHAALGMALQLAIDLTPDLECVGLASTIAGALELVARSHPHVLLTDVRLPDGNGIEATVRVKEIRPEASVIVLTADPDPDTVLRAAHAGASGYLAKDRRITEIVDAVRRVAGGETVFPPWFVPPPG